MPKSYCYTVSLCVCLWGRVMFVPVGWVLVIFLFCPSHTGSSSRLLSLCSPQPLCSHPLDAALEKDRPPMFNPVTWEMKE